MVLCIGLFKNCSFLHPVKLFSFLFYISLLLVYSIFERNYRFDRSVCILFKNYCAIYYAAILHFLCSVP